jgi:hypothetical protein
MYVVICHKSTIKYTTSQLIKSEFTSNLQAIKQIDSSGQGYKRHDKVYRGYGKKCWKGEQ